VPSRPLATSAGVVAALVLGAGAVTLLPGAAPVASAEGLVPYESCGQLLDHYRTELEKSAQPWGFGGGWGGIAFAESSGRVAVPAAAGVGVAGASSGGDDSTGGAVGSGATGTNLQERGVDEPDVAKTSDGLLLAIAHSRLQVVRGGAQPELLSSTPLGQDTWGAELLVDGNRVLVLAPHGGHWGHRAASSRSMPAGQHGSATSALLFDIADATRPRLLETLQLDGRYLSARLSDGAVRLVTSSYPTPESTQPAAPHGQAEMDAALQENRKRALSVGLADVLPTMQLRDGDGELLTTEQAIDCEQVRHAPEPRGASTLLVTTLDLDRGLEPRDTDAVTTDGDLVYASADRLYVATSRWGTAAPAAGDDTISSRPSDTSTAQVESEVTTELHAFDTSAPDRTSYSGSGSVDGYVLGRWALSSYDGHLRVATTSSPPWGGDEPSSSSVIVLEERDNGLVQTGRVNGLGIGERIYAVRYFGDLATVVTFRQTDPLYVLDLGNPAAPKLLGELKIPGFSTYLHPVGDDLLMGVGQDADAQGRVTGMQVSLFDLADLSKPTQVDRLPLGQGWTQAGNDSRAFGFDVDRGTARLPLSVWDGSGGWYGALGVRVEGNKLIEAGRMEIVAAPAERVLSDGEHLYAVSSLGIVAGDPDSFERSGAVDFGR
jgi:uncharacterized secreted protein with C-terminal beta-propeller domain